MRIVWKLSSVGVVLLLISVTFQPAVAELYDEDWDVPELDILPMDEVPPPFLELAALASDLQNATPLANRTDSDGDTLWDPVEVVIGTDPYNPDSDSDRLPDNVEVFSGIDPNNPDSNRDRYPDVLEVNSIKPDLDGDGVPNAWDWDNDGDGVMDDMDLSPMARTSLSSSYHLDINTSGRPTYIDFQVTTKNPDNLRLINQVWDWPYDDKGSMQDLDGSKEDVEAVPSLMLTANQVPSQEAVAQYGVVINGDVAYLPIFPTVEFGNVVAFRSRMFYPSTGKPLNLSLDLELIWTINGKSDFYLKSLMAPGNVYVTSGEDGDVNANSSTVGDEQKYEWVRVGDDQLGLRASNGRFLTLRSDGSIGADDVEMTRNSTFTTVLSPPDLFALKAENDLYLTVEPDGSLAADAEQGQAHYFKVGDQGIGSRIKTLVTYYEDFVLTGLSVDESYGTDYAVVYDIDPHEVLKGNLILSYEFLRNATTSVSDIPSLLSAHSVAPSVISKSFEHEDVALQWLTANATMKALDDLPDGKVMPLLFALEDRRACMDLDDLVTTSHVLGSDLHMDVTMARVVTSKSMKTPWYNTSGIQPLEFETIMEEVRTWDLDDSSLTITTGLLLAWNAGESEVVRVNSTETTYNYPEKGGVINQTIVNWGKVGIKAIGVLSKSFNLLKAAYYFVQFVRIESLAKTAGQTSWGLYKAMYQSLNTGKTVMSKIGKFLGWVGIAVEIVMMYYTFFTMADAMDWHPIGTMCAAIYAMTMAAYGIGLTVLAMAGGPVGAIIAAVLALVDIFFIIFTGDSWLSLVMQEFIEWLYDVFTKTEKRSDVELGFVNSSFDVDDKDGNGIDVGDRFTFNSTLYGNVTITSDGGWNDLLESYIVPKQTVGVPWSSMSASEMSTTQNGADQFFPGKRSTLYDTSAWVEPGIPMINYQLSIGMHTDYRVYYDDCWWLFGWHCDRESQTESTDSSWTTMHFDVMPGSIDSFADWRGITSNDWDGDGINNTDETDTSQWLWDTDGDGLGDAHERDGRSDPTKADTDSDGLSDRYEYIWGLNQTNSDSDGDGLSDYLEWSGWVVTFDYFGTEFNWNIYSNYCTNNTDGDDLSDFMEWRCLLNPMTNDTDGDGRLDELRDYYIHDLEYGHFFTISGVNERTMDMEVDEDGNIYVSYAKGDYMGGGIVKFSKDLVQLAHWTLNFSSPNGMFIDDDGFLWVTDHEKGLYKLYTSNGTVAHFMAGWPLGGRTFINLYDIVVDSQGIIYGLDIEMQWLTKFYSNGTKIGTYDGPAMDPMRWPQSIYMDDEETIYVADSGKNRILVLDTNMTLLKKWGKSDGSAGTGLKQFNWPRGVFVDDDGNVLVSESGGRRVQKFDKRGNYLANFTLDLNGTQQLRYPYGIAAAGGYGYVCDVNPSNVYGVHRLFNNVTFVPSTPPTDIPDLDGDGLLNAFEETGWTISIVESSGPRAYTVESDPLVMDTDGDGLNDTEEYNIGCDPGSGDTDGDGIPDHREVLIGTNASHFDTDGEGLADGIELTFESDPLDTDTDDDNLTDHQEFLLGTDPNAKDTDQDGLDDDAEVAFGSDPLDPDSDDDFLFDSMELLLGTAPYTKDHDGDGISDGFELLYNTTPTNPDSDGDGVSDGFEVSSRMNPRSNDTDGDGMLDGEELANGLNPRNDDSDGDGVPDLLDKDSELLFEHDVYLVVDADESTARFVKDLSDKVDVIMVTPRELLENHTGERYIVLVGDPSNGAGTAGAIIRDCLGDTGEVLERMLASDADRLAARYGYWTGEQTIVMLSTPYPSDHIRVVGMLKSMTVTVGDGSISVQFLNARSCFKLDDVDMVKETGSLVWTKLDDMATFNVSVAGYDGTTAPWEMDNTTGLEPVEVSLGRFVVIDVSENLQNESGDMITGVHMQMFYTLEDLDRTGDGDADDPMDIDEEQLTLYILDATTGNWTRMTEDLDWVDATGVNTSDFHLYGDEYAGYVWANITHLSAFGLAGRTRGVLDVIARAGDDIRITAGEGISFDGSTSSGNGRIESWKWSFIYDGTPTELVGETAYFKFEIPGEYTVTLEVEDYLGLKATDVVIVTVVEPPPGHWMLAIGPVEDEDGNALEGAKVTLAIGDETLENTTDVGGIAYFDMLDSQVGLDVTITITLLGYERGELATMISTERVLADPLPALVKVVDIVPTHAVPGTDITVTEGDSVHFDGRASEGNGEISNFTWSFEYDGGTVTLYGPQPVFTFNIPGEYVVTLNVTDSLDRQDEASVTVTVEQKVPPTEFTLLVGPIVDNLFKPIGGATVTIVIGDYETSNTSDTEGMTGFLLPIDNIGKAIRITIKKEGFKDASLDTSITADQKLEGTLPSMVKKDDVEPPDGTKDDGLPSGVVFGAIAAIIIVVVLALLVFTGYLGVIIGRRSARTEEEGLEGRTELRATDLEVDVEDDDDVEVLLDPSDEPDGTDIEPSDVGTERPDKMNEEVIEQELEVEEGDQKD